MNHYMIEIGLNFPVVVYVDALSEEDALSQAQLKTAIGGPSRVTQITCPLEIAQFNPGSPAPSSTQKPIIQFKTR